MSNFLNKLGFTAPREKDNENVFSLSSNAGVANARRAFTLIEMMVAVTIFSIVMLIGVGALLSLVETNKRAQAINSVIANLNAAIEGMSRSIRVGTTYRCEEDAQPDYESIENVRDCASGGGKLLAFEAATGDLSDPNDQVVYRWNGTQLERSLNSGVTWVALTAPEISIDSFELFVVGTNTLLTSSDTTQPRVVMVIKGSAPVPGGETNFSVQASVTQRLIDI